MPEISRVEEAALAADEAASTAEHRKPLLPLRRGSVFLHKERISVVFCVLVVSLASVQLGFTLGYSSPAQSQIMEDLGLSLIEFSIFGSLVTVGAVAGAITSAQTHHNNRCGRKGWILIAAIPNIFGWLSICITRDAAILYIGRIMCSFGVGIISHTVPVYIAEISTPDLRGRLGAANQLAVSLGILLAYFFGMFVHWRPLALLGIFPSFALFPSLFFIPESPWSLARMGQDFEVSLLYLRGLASEIVEEKEEIKRSTDSSRATITICSEELREKKYWYLVMLGVGLFTLQQLCGINGLLFYSSYLLESAGISNGNLATFVLGLILVLATGVATWLVDKAGRRFLLVVSASGMTLSLLLTTVAFYVEVAISSDSRFYVWIQLLSFAGIVGMVISFSLGVGPMPWIIVSEIFPMEIKHLAGNLITLANFLTMWVITLTSILLLSWNKAGTFTMYTLFSALTIAFVKCWLPSTKGRTLEEIQAYILSTVLRGDSDRHLINSAYGVVGARANAKIALLTENRAPFYRLISNVKV